MEISSKWPARNWSEHWNSIGTILVDHALTNLNREYPHAAIGCEVPEVDWAQPSARHPVFFGAYDWHSAVHNHWLLLRAVSLGLPEHLTTEISEVLDQRFTPEKLSTELAFLEIPGNNGFERPYGLSWLLFLIAELKDSPLPMAGKWRGYFHSLESLAVARLTEYFKALAWPVRSGVHNNTAYSLNLCLSYAREGECPAFEQLIEERSRSLYSSDHGYNPSFEPSAEDFLSPGLEEMVLMSRILATGDFGEWTQQFLVPDSVLSNKASWLTPINKINQSDGRLVHLAGLNLSRAYALHQLSKFPELKEIYGHLIGPCAHQHLITGLKQIESGGFSGTHWLPTLAIKAISAR